MHTIECRARNITDDCKALGVHARHLDPGIRPLELLAADSGASLLFLEGLRARGLVFQET